MEINLTLNKGTLMFVIGLALAIASISTAAFARQPKVAPTGWQYKLVDFHGDSQTKDGWEPIGFIPQEGNEWAKVFERKPIN
jgi:hypothetical protein